MPLRSGELACLIIRQPPGVVLAVFKENMNTRLRSTLIFAALLALTACSRGKTTKLVVADDDGTTNFTQTVFTCNAVLSKTVVAAGETVTLQVTASGGAAPYSIPNYATNFASSTSLYGSYNNLGSTDLVVNRTVNVVDAIGGIASCGFTVTVLSPTAGASNLACNIDYSPNPVKPGVTTSFTISASGGTGFYTFGTFSPRSGVTVTTNTISSAQVSATTTYPDLGTYTAYMTVSNNGRLATCSKQILVSNPLLSLYGSPSSTSDASTPIQLNAMYSGFPAGLIPEFTYTSTEPGILITKNPGQASAEVKVVDGGTHDFTVTVTAAIESVTATSSIRLVFTPSLNCSISVSANPVANSPVRFTASASTGEPLSITVFKGADSVVPISNSVVDAKFFTGGERLVQIQARSLSRNILCNGGAAITQFVKIGSALNRCDVVISPTTAIVGTPVAVSAAIPSGVGVGPFKIDLTSDGSYQTVIPAAGLTQTVKFQIPGNWKLDLKVTDLYSGTAVSCSAYHVAAVAAGLEARVFALPVNYSSLTDTYDTRISNQKFTAYNIDVPSTSWNQGFPGVLTYREWYAVSFRGRMNITTAGIYKFKLLSDDGVLLYIDGALVVQDNSLHPPRDSYGSISLSAGYHDIKLLYFQGPATLIACQLSWQPPYQSFYSVVPSSIFSQPLNPLP